MDCLEKAWNAQTNCDCCDDKQKSHVGDVVRTRQLEGKIDSGIQLHQHQSCYVMSTRQSLLNLNYLNESEDKFPLRQLQQMFCCVILTAMSQKRLNAKGN